MKKNKNPKLGYIIATNKSYGRLLKGTKIYFEGKKPKALRKDGSIQFGKNVLEKLKRRFGDNFKLIITQSEDSIKKEIRYYYVRVSQKTLSSINGELIMQKKDIKNEILDQKFPKIFPEFFESTSDIRPYAPGSLAKFLHTGILNKLSREDKKAMIDFIPEFISSESVSSVNLIKAEAQIESLKGLADEIKAAMENNKGESWWQTFIKANILIIQQGYIKAIDKMNVSLGGTNFPDFSLVTHDNYLDILEIKKPTTNLLKFDASRDNYYWDPEVSKAIIQTENYIKNVD